MKEIAMALVADIKKTVTDTTPVYAAVGATDLAVEKVRDVRVRATAARAELSAEKLQARVSKRATEVTEQAQHAPVVALNRSLELATKAYDSYESLATRGESLVKRLRTQKATKDLLAQAETTVALGKGAVTTVRKAAGEVERSAKATLTTGRHQAEAVAEVAVESAQAEAREVTEAATESAKRTRSAAKRTTTTTKKSAAATRSSAKRATTGARKTAAAAKKASADAAKKVGD
jgi:heparin binding hemagglutinin HbhA